MEAAGGANNAYTSKDVTVYMDWFPKSALEAVLELEGDRLANLAIDPDVVETERGAVASERRQGVDDSHAGLLQEQMFANAYIAHPYQNPVIGWPSDIENWTQEDLEAFYRRFYAPNNISFSPFSLTATRRGCIVRSSKRGAWRSASVAVKRTDLIRASPISR
jgi:zinc protease